MRYDEVFADPAAGASVLHALGQTGSNFLHTNKAQRGAPQWARDELARTPMHPSVLEAEMLFIQTLSIHKFWADVDVKAQVVAGSGLVDFLRGANCTAREKLADWRACAEKEQAAVRASFAQLRGSTPRGGTYYSEMDYGEPDWQNSTWGPDNYAKLLAIKRAWDPALLFTCHHCVGSEYA